MMPPPPPAVTGIRYAYVCQYHRVHGFREWLGVRGLDPIPPFDKIICIIIVKLPKTNLGNPHTPLQMHLLL